MDKDTLKVIDLHHFPSLSPPAPLSRARFASDSGSVVPHDPLDPSAQTGTLTWVPSPAPDASRAPSLRPPRASRRDPLRETLPLQSPHFVVGLLTLTDLSLLNQFHCGHRRCLSPHPLLRGGWGRVNSPSSVTSSLILSMSFYFRPHLSCLPPLSFPSSSTLVIRHSCPRSNPRSPRP